MSRTAKTPGPPRRGRGDPGTLICSHDGRIHALGGGIWVCFRCWARLLTGYGVQDKAGG